MFRNFRLLILGTGSGLAEFSQAREGSHFHRAWQTKVVKNEAINISNNVREYVEVLMKSQSPLAIYMTIYRMTKEEEYKNCEIIGIPQRGISAELQTFGLQKQSPYTKLFSFYIKVIFLPEARES